MTDRHSTDGGSRRDEPENGQQLTYEIDDDELPSEAVIRAVAAVKNTSVISLDPLFDVIDPDSVDETFAKRGAPTSTELTFQFNGCKVTVTADEVHVREADTST